MLVLQSLPESQKEIIIEALALLEAKYAAFYERNESDIEASQKCFDALVLKAMMKYDVNIVLSEKQLDNFTADNGVDFPEFV
jgi:hypothetical protein